MRHKVYCDGESVYVDGEFVVDCCESLDCTFEAIASALDADYEYTDELENN